MMDSNNILSKFSEKEFLDTYWDKQIFFEKNFIKYPENIFSLMMCSDLLNYSYQFRGGDDVKLIKEGALLASNMYSKESGGISLTKVKQFYSSGYTIKLKGLERFCSSIRTMQESAVQQFKRRIHVNSYLSPKMSTGLSLHYDMHDIFVLQIDGSKEWELFDIQSPLITKRAIHSLVPTELRPQNPKRIISLNKGDLLYLPKGTWHKAKATDEYSLHVVIGINPLTKHDYYQYMLKGNMQSYDDFLDFNEVHSLDFKLIDATDWERYLVQSNIINNIDFSNEK